LSYKKYYVNQNIEMTKCHLTLTTEFLTLKGSGGWGCPFIEICTVQMGEQTCPMQTSEQTCPMQMSEQTYPITNELRHSVMIK